MLPVKIYLLSVTRSSILSPPGAKGWVFLSGRVVRTQAFRPALANKHASDSSSRQGSEAMSPAETKIAARVGKLRPGAPAGHIFGCLLEQIFARSSARLAARPSVFFPQLRR